MALEKEHFVNYTEDEERRKKKGRPVSVWFNEEELEELEYYGKIFQQEKIGSVIKDLIEYGKILIDEDSTGRIIKQTFKNINNNKRIGITIPEPKFRNSNRL